MLEDREISGRVLVLIVWSDEEESRHMSGRRDLLRDIGGHQILFLLLWVI